MKWQCHVRQIAMRQHQGRPDEAIRPEVELPGQGSVGQITTVLNRDPDHSATPELDHIAACTHDPAERLEQALKFLSAGYYQRHRRFSDILTATFAQHSEIAGRVVDAGRCLLRFNAYGQRFDLSCRVGRLQANDPLFLSTLAHNRLFNPTFQPDIQILGFEPDWDTVTTGARAA